MKKIPVFPVIALITVLVITGGSSSIDSGDNPWLGKYNIIWDSSSGDVSSSMPAGGGDIGCNVWVEKGDLMFYFQRSGSLSETGEYLKMGRVRVKLEPNPFMNSSSFRQELLLEKGHIEIEARGNGTRALIRFWVEVKNPVIHLDISADKPVNVTALYENWRSEERELSSENNGRERFGCFNLQGYPGKVIKHPDIVGYNGNDVMFYHSNPADKLIPEVLIKMEGLSAMKDSIPDDLKNRISGGVMTGKNFIAGETGSGKYISTPYKSWSLKSRKPSRNHNLSIVTHIAQVKGEDAWKNELQRKKKEAESNSGKAFAETVSWWKDFWNRSYIVLSPLKNDPEDIFWKAGRNYQLFRYQLGCNAFGEYPTKFNGGNLTFDPVLTEENSKFDPDWRAWGGDVFTAQNQRLVYWPMLKAGDFDAILPQFELYRKGLPGAKARVKTHFGHDGAVYCEYTSVPGIAFGAGWGWTDGTMRKRGPEVPFGDPSVNGLAGYDAPAEKGEMANPAVAYHWESQLEHSWMILEYNRFTGNDISVYMPFIKSSLIFFDQHYQLRQKMRDGRTLDENGKLVIYPSTSCESYRGATNPTDIIAGLKACLEGILALDEKYVSPAEKKYYSEFLRRVPDIAFGDSGTGKIVKPAHQWLKESNQELPQFYPLFPFNRYSLGDDEIEIFKNTYNAAPAFRKGKIISWHQDGIFFARMGMVNEAADYNMRKLADSGRRFPTFWGPGHDWVPDHNWGGSGMIGLQEMLLQTNGNELMIFPAWPADRDVDFKLHAPGNTTVECSLRNGEITSLVVTPESRKKDIVNGLKKQF